LVGLLRWGGAAALAAAAFAGASAPAAASCLVVSEGPAYGQSWAERRQELLARNNAARPGATLFLYAPPAKKAPTCAALAASSEVRFRLELIAPTWQRYGALVTAAAQRHGVPAELILATIVDESGGKPSAVATNPGYISDAATPDKVSVGLGQILISSARRLAPGQRIDRATLSDPAVSIDLIAHYHARFYRGTGFDPRLVAAAYMSGSAPALRAGQRWYPRHLRHAARYTAVFEASVAHLSVQQTPPPVSFAAVFAVQ